MQAAKPRPPVVVVTGPTCGGKSHLALALAERIGGEIVNADSMQVYQYMDVGTAKPNAAERQRVPHHLFDIVTPDTPYDAGRYLREAREAAARIHERGGRVLLVGGTGLYIRAFLEGLVESGGADKRLREEFEQEHASAVAEGDPERLHRRLAAIDPETAAKIHPNDLRRIVRALEISRRGGEPVSAQRRAHGFQDRPYRALHLALDPGRDALDERIAARSRVMIEAGLLQEVRALLERGYGWELRPMQAIGYRHMRPVVEAEDTLPSAREAIERDTRRFARRQRTWLRKVEDAIWVRPDDPDAVTKRVEEFLAGADQLT